MQQGLFELNDCEILIEIDKTDRSYLGIVRSGNLLIFVDESLDANLKDQLEIPFDALQWAIDTIEIGFGNSLEDGGLPRDVLHDETVIDGEEINLRRTMNCGAAYQPGYTISNFHRESYIDNDDPQAVQLPDYLLFDEGLLEKLKKKLPGFVDTSRVAYNTVG